MPLYRVHVTTEARREAVRVEGKTILVSVRAAAENNQANVAVLRLVKQHLHVKRIELVSGNHKPHKVVRAT